MAGFNAAEAAHRLMMMDPRNQTAGMGSPAHTAPSVPGIAGTPGGAHQESPTMQLERLLQMIPGLAATGVTGYGAVTGNPLALMTGGGGMMATDSLTKNAMEPNIRDVWADKLRMMMQGN